MNKTIGNLARTLEIVGRILPYFADWRVIRTMHEFSIHINVFPQKGEALEVYTVVQQY